MEQLLTLVCKLQATPEDAAKIEASLHRFCDACNWVNDNTDPKLTNKVALQALSYHTIKPMFGLVANMAVRACARVAANRKTAKQKGKPVKRFKPSSTDLDRDLFRFREKDMTVSLATSEYVKSLTLIKTDDAIIWEYARTNNFAIVSKNSDFYQRSLLQGHPPKFIYLRVGHFPTSRNVKT